MGVPGGTAFTRGNVSTFSAALNPDTTYSAEKIVQYTRGVALENPTIFSSESFPDGGSSASFRDRTLDEAKTKVWKLGDVINSTPKVVGNIGQNTYFIDYGDTSYYNFISSDSFRKRASIAIIGANDGMLHAFRAGYLKDKGPFGDGVANTKALFKNWHGAGDGEHSLIGEEVWAYIPYNLLPYLKYYASPEYSGCHIYGVDLSIKIFDVSINGTAGGTRDADSWRTILIGGMRFGGSCKNGMDPTGPPLSGVGFSSYFALDMTDYLTESGVVLNPGAAKMPKPLWEFTDDDLGYTTSSPAVVRTGSMSENGNWYVVVGSGPTQLARTDPSQDVNRDKNGYIYILNLKTGALVKKIGLGSTHNAIVGDILSIDAEKDYYTEKLYFGTSYKSGSNWAGKLMKLNLGSDITALCGSGSGPFEDCGSLSVLFKGNYPFTASPDVAKDENGNVWVYAGSGKYFSSLDEKDTSQQVFVGIKDKTTWTGPATATKLAGCPASCTSDTALCDVTLCKTTALVPTQGGRSQVCVFNGSTSSLQTVVSAVTNGQSNAPQNKAGWVLFLDTMERVISRPLAAGGVVDFLTYMPNSSVCSKGGNSYLYAVDYVRGSPPTNLAIRGHMNSTTDTSAATGVQGSVNVEKKVLLGPGAPPTGEAIIITPPKEGQDRLKKKIQVSTGVIVETENKPVLSIISEILNWLKK